MNPSSFGKIFK